MTNPLTIVVFVLPVSIAFAAYIAMPYIMGYLLLRQREKERAKNKNLIRNLSLMKQIQTDLENELQESLIREGVAKSPA